MWSPDRIRKNSAEDSILSSSLTFDLILRSASHVPSLKAGKNLGELKSRLSSRTSGLSELKIERVSYKVEYYIAKSISEKLNVPNIGPFFGPTLGGVPNER